MEETTDNIASSDQAQEQAPLLAHAVNDDDASRNVVKTVSLSICCLIIMFNTAGLSFLPAAVDTILESSLEARLCPGVETASCNGAVQRELTYLRAAKSIVDSFADKQPNATLVSQGP